MNTQDDSPLSLVALTIYLLNKKIDINIHSTMYHGNENSFHNTVKDGSGWYIDLESNKIKDNGDTSKYP